MLANSSGIAALHLQCRRDSTHAPSVITGLQCLPAMRQVSGPSPVAPALAIFHDQEPGSHALVRSGLDAVHAAPNALIHVPQHHLLNRHGMSMLAPLDLTESSVLPCPKVWQPRDRWQGLLCSGAA